MPATAGSPIYIETQKDYLEPNQFANEEPISIEGKILRAFPDDYERMLAVAKCESGLNQDAVSHTNDYGLFQVNEATWHNVAVEMGLDYKNDIDDNIAMAQHIYEVQGINAWVCWWRYLA